MRAVLIEALEGPDGLALREVEPPTARSGQVVIDVHAAGVNFPDLLMTRGAYQFRPPLPFSPGGECAGVVSEVGEGVTGLAVGDRVLAISLAGTWAEKVALPADRVSKIPDAMDLTTAGAFAFTYGTSYHALVDRAHLEPGEVLLVLGAAGGVGLAAVEIGGALGAKVIAAASTREKLDLCERFGATGTIEYSSEDLKSRAKVLSQGGVSVVYDPVGGDFAEAALRTLRPGGRFLVIGFAAGSIPSIPLNLPLLKEAQIVGVLWGSWTMRNPDRHAENMRALFDLFEAGKLRGHVSRTYPMSEAAQALRDMEARKVTGKVALVPG